MSLKVTITGGTGGLDGEYVTWNETALTLSADTTNYVFVTDSDGDGQGEVELNQTGFPAACVPLYEFDTDADSVTSVTDARKALIKRKTASSDMEFQTVFGVNDTELSMDTVRSFLTQFTVDESDPTAEAQPGVYDSGYGYEGSDFVARYE